MLLIVAAIVAGIVVGLILGGSFANLAQIQFRWWPLAILGFGLQLIPTPASREWHWVGVALLAASYALLIVFVTANVRYRGLVVMAVGFALNILVISLNGGMPVSDAALRQAYGPGYRATLTDLREHGGAKHHLQRPDDELTALSDVVPVGTPVHRVFSPGDVVALVGVAWVLAEAMLGRGRRSEVPPGDRGSATPG